VVRADDRTAHVLESDDVIGHLTEHPVVDALDPPFTVPWLKVHLLQRPA